mmetsp:Transcript_13456/g.26417  ORF Transcript_13456/g.26417 Transcript_13456/m.26417 type:complete len:251 (+) Transcript_13456:724-1476(+)
MNWRTRVEALPQIDFFCIISSDPRLGLRFCCCVRFVSVLRTDRDPASGSLRRLFLMRFTVPPGLVKNPLTPFHHPRSSRAMGTLVSVRTPGSSLTRVEREPLLLSLNHSKNGFSRCMVDSTGLLPGSAMAEGSKRSSNETFLAATASISTFFNSSSSWRRCRIPRWRSVTNAVSATPRDTWLIRLVFNSLRNFSRASRSRAIALRSSSRFELNFSTSGFVVPLSPISLLSCESISSSKLCKRRRRLSWSV